MPAEAHQKNARRLLCLAGRCFIESANEYFSKDKKRVMISRRSFMALFGLIACLMSMCSGHFGSGLCGEWNRVAVEKPVRGS